MSRDLIERLQHCIVSEAPGSWRKETMRGAADRIIELEAEIEEMTPKFVAYDYLVSPAGEEMALEENARLRARMEEGERRGLERAAEVADQHFQDRQRSWRESRVDLEGSRSLEAKDIATAIRALMPEAPAREGWQPISSAPELDRVLARPVLPPPPSQDREPDSQRGAK